jgi:tellurite resistance protein TehA-like permease
MSGFTDVPDLKKSPVLIIGLSLFALIMVAGFVFGLAKDHDYNLLIELVLAILILLVIVFSVISVRKHMSEESKEHLESTFWSLSKGNYYRAGPLWMVLTLIVVLIYFIYTGLNGGVTEHCSISNLFSIGHLCVF